MLKLMKPKKYISADKNSAFVRNVMGRNVGNVSYLMAEEELIFAQLPGASENNELEELLRLLQMLATVLEGGLGFGNYKRETYIINQLRIMFESSRVMLSQDALYQQLQSLYNEIVENIENKNVYENSGSEFLKNVKNELLDYRSELNRRVLNIRNLHEADTSISNIVSENKKIAPHYRRNINVSEENLSINTINYNMFNMLHRNRSLIEQAKDNYFFRESLAVYSKKNQRKYQFRQQITNFLDKLTPNQQSFILEFAKNEHMLSIEKNTASGEKKTDVYAVFKNASEREIRQFFARLKKFSEKKIIEKELKKKIETQNEKSELRRWQEHTRESFFDVLGEVFSNNGKEELYNLFSEENIARFTESDRTNKTDRENLMSVIVQIKEILEKKKNRDMVKTVSHMNADTLIAYSDSVMNYIQNNETDFTDETLKLEENLEQIYYGGNFNQDGVRQIRELMSDYYLTVKNDELESVAESFFGTESDGKIKEILRFLNRQELDSIAVFLRLFEGEYSEITELLENYENEKSLFLNSEINRIAKNEKITENEEIKENSENIENSQNQKTEHNENISKISEGLSESLIGLFEKIKTEEEAELISIVDETTDEILRKNVTLTCMQQYATENDRKEEYEEFINKIEELFKSGLVNSYKQYNGGQRDYQEIRNEIFELLGNEEISRSFVKYLRLEKSQIQEEIFAKLEKTQIREENNQSFVRAQAHEEKLENFTESQLTDRLSESLFLELKQLDDTVKNEVKEKFSASGQSVIYFETTEKTTDRTIDKTDSVKVSSREILKDKDVVSTEKYKTDIFSTERLKEKSEKQVRDESVLHENKTTTVNAEELLDAKQVSSVSIDELLRDSHFSSTVSEEISDVLMDKLLDESPELTYLQEYATEIGQINEFTILLRKIEGRLEENLLKNEKKILRLSEEITDGKTKTIAEGKSEVYLFDSEIETEIQNILLNDDLSLKFIRHLQDREETISQRTTDKLTKKLSKDVIERYETVDFKNMTETEIASIISLTLERIFAGLETDFTSGISKKASKLSLLSDEIQNVQVGLNSEAFVERLMKESPELTLLRQYAEETEREEEFEGLLKKIEENFKTDIQQSINHMQNEDISVWGSKSQSLDIVGKNTTHYDEHSVELSDEMSYELLDELSYEEKDEKSDKNSDEKTYEKTYEKTDEQSDKKYHRENNIVYRSEGVVKEIQELLVNEEFSRDFIRHLTETAKNTGKSRILKAADEVTELKTAEMLSEYLVDRLNKVQTDTGEVNISKTNINKINTDVMQGEIQNVIQREIKNNLQHETQNNIRYETKNEKLYETDNRTQYETQNEKLYETDNRTQDEINSSMVYEMRNTVSETNRLSEEIFTDDSWLTYMKNYAVETERENQLRTLLQKIEDKLEKDIQTGELRYTLEKDTQTEEIRHTLEKSMQENQGYRLDELTYNTESLKTEIQYLLENSEISRSFIRHFDNTEETFLSKTAKAKQYITENAETLTQITELLEYRTDIRTDMQAYLRQNQMYYTDDIKNSRYQSLLHENLSYQYASSAEEYFENSKTTGEIQYALQSVDNEGADNERVEKLLGDVKQKLEQVTRNVNTLNSAQNNMKEEFIRKNDMVSFRKELLNHLEEDISTAGKRQGILH